MLREFFDFSIEMCTFVPYTLSYLKSIYHSEVVLIDDSNRSCLINHVPMNQTGLDVIRQTYIG